MFVWRLTWLLHCVIKKSFLTIEPLISALLVKVSCEIALTTSAGLFGTRSLWHQLFLRKQSVNSPQKGLWNPADSTPQPSPCAGVNRGTTWAPMQTDHIKVFHFWFQTKRLPAEGSVVASVHRKVSGPGELLGSHFAPWLRKRSQRKITDVHLTKSFHVCCTSVSF